MASPACTVSYDRYVLPNVYNFDPHRAPNHQITEGEFSTIAVDKTVEKPVRIAGRALPRLCRDNCACKSGTAFRGDAMPPASRTRLDRAEPGRTSTCPCRRRATRCKAAREALWDMATNHGAFILLVSVRSSNLLTSHSRITASFARVRREHARRF